MAEAMSVKPADRGAPAAGPERALIQLRGVTKVYAAAGVPVPALRGIDLDVADGEFTTLAGPSGCGKTTLLNIIGALDRATAGAVEVAGRHLSLLGTAEAADFRLENVGFIFQAYNLVPVLTAFENAEFTLLLRGVRPAERRRVVLPLLSVVGLADVAHRKPHELSGGQQQRVAIVRALATSPRLVLADEPTANLDSAASEALITLMRDLNRELGTTFLLSSHDHLVIREARRVVHLLDGRVERES